MFAFAIADLRSNQLFIARDQLGIKPLFYIHTEKVFAFASEIQALRAMPGLQLDLDLTAIDQYLFLQYIPAPKTAFRQVKKLKPAHRLLISFDGRTQGTEEYWDVVFQPNFTRTEEELLDATENLLFESVKAHLLSDVPFGAFLSGGIDSSGIVAFMSQILEKPVRTFTIGFDEQEFNELPFADIASKRWETNHYVEIIKPNALEILPRLVKHYGEPFGDSSALPTYYVSQMASKHVPMVLSGDGGDEFFGGYGTYLYWTSWLTGKGRPWIKKILRSALQQFLPNKFPTRKINLDTWYNLINYLSLSQRIDLWRPEYQHICSSYVEEFDRHFSKSVQLDIRSIVQYLDINTYLPYDILTKVDVASMMHGLEVRTPLVDIKVAEFMASVPPEYNIALNGEGKYEGKLLLKQILKKYYPEDFLVRGKKGFSIPTQKWFSTGEELHKDISSILLDSNSHLSDYFELHAIKNLFKKNLFGPIWCLLFLEEWLKQL